MKHSSNTTETNSRCFYLRLNRFSINSAFRRMCTPAVYVEDFISRVIGTRCNTRNEVEIKQLLLSVLTQGLIAIKLKECNVQE